MKYLTLVVMTVLLIGISGFCGELHDVKMPDKETVSSKDLILNGMGLRDVSILGVYIHVYVGGLFLEKKSQNGDEILASPEIKKVTMHFLRKVSANDIKKGWQKGIEDNCESRCKDFKDKTEAFKNLMVDVKADDELNYVFDSKGLTVDINGKKLGQVDGPDFAKTVLAAWIGAKPVTWELKNGLLTGKN